MTRHEIRQAALKLLYEWDLGGEGGDETLFGLLALTDEAGAKDAEAAFEQTTAQIERIDTLIREHLRGWSLDRVSKVDLAILRLGTGALVKADLAPGIVINEALLLAEEFSSDRSRAFINGVLGSISRELQD